MKVAVVTPTINSVFLEKCLESVQSQTCDRLTHYIFVDGKEHFAGVKEKIESNKFKNISLITLDENVGKGWYGHRVYAASSFLVNSDVICYLDEDNWFEPDHVKNLTKKLMFGAQWAYSLRKIYDKEGNYVCNDNCESLGKWPVYFNDKVFHIDTSSFAVRTDVAVHIGHAWYGQWGADRKFFHNLSTHFPNYDCTNEYSLCYRLDGNPNSVTKEFFEQGNKVMKEKHGSSFPWNEKMNFNSVEIAPGLTLV